MKYRGYEIIKLGTRHYIYLEYKGESHLILQVKTLKEAKEFIDYRAVRLSR